MVQAGQQDLKCIIFTKFKGVIMLEKIGFYLFMVFLITIAAWVLFCVAPVMIETTMSALELWKEIL